MDEPVNDVEGPLGLLHHLRVLGLVLECGLTKELCSRYVSRVRFSLDSIELIGFSFPL